jgi:CRISPR-associated protein Csd2
VGAIQHRYDFVFLFDCQDGNPNGDPDAENRPRVDPETCQGLVTDVCLKRKIRDYVLHAHTINGKVEHGYDVFVLAGASLESRQRLPYGHLKGEIVPSGSKTELADIAKARDWMCKNFFDVRAFGAVMSTTAFNCGQVRGPVQLTFARSIDRVSTTEHIITRQAFTGEKETRSGPGTTFGRKYTVAYGLYRAHGFINPVFAEKTDFSEIDLRALWQALSFMFEVDRSAARGLMTTRGLIIFRHDSRLGSAPAHGLFDSVSISLRKGVVSPRSFSDYVVTIPEQSALPQGVTLISPLS